MDLAEDVERVGRDRLGRLFKYVAAWNQLGNPPKRLIRDQIWSYWLRDLPQHPDVRIGEYEDRAADESLTDSELDAAFILKVKRPKTTNPPSPPTELRDWIQAGWERVDGTIEVQSSHNIVDRHGQTQIINFDADPSRPIALRKWRQTWAEW